MNVGYRLYREVLDFAPADLSSGELIVALVIADDARDQNRVSWITLPLLCARTRLKPSSVRAALSKLASRGYEFRVPHGYGKDGRPVFAARGHAVDYVVPDMTIAATPLAPISQAQPVDNHSQSRQFPSAYAGPKALGIESKALENGSKGARELAPLPSDPLSTPQLKPLT